MAYIGIDPNVGDISFQQFTGDGSTTAFTLAQSVASGEAVIVTIGNVVQEPGASAAYTAYANTLTFSAAPANGDVITVRYFGRAVDQPLSYGMQLFKYVATASQTVFTGADSNGAILAFSGTDVDVYLNGVHLDADDFTPSSGNTITLATGASLNDDLVVRAFRAFSVTDTVSASSGGTFNGAVTFDAGANFGDNDKAIFGAGSDLQIYHDGSHSYLQDNGTGEFRIKTNGSIIQFLDNSNNYLIRASVGDSVGLYFNTAQKLATTATGVDVTGTITSDGLSVDGTLTVNGTGGQITTDNNGFITSKQSLDVATAGGRFIGKSNRGELGQIAVEQTATGADGGYIRFSTSPSGSTSPTERMRIDSSGFVGIGGSETTVFNGTGGDMKFVVIGDDSTTTVANNSDAGIAIVNTNQTAGNLAGLHFARADTDNTPNYAGASIVAQFPDAQVTGQYPRGDLAFLTSTATNSAPSEKMRITSAGNVGIGTTSPTGAKLHVVGGVKATDLIAHDTTGINLQTSDGTKRLIVDNSGNVGIGHSTPQFGLTMAQGNGDASRIGWEDGGNSKRASIICASSSDALQFHTGTSDTERMRITSGGSLLLGSTAHEWSSSMAAQIDGSKGLAVFSSGATSEVIACWNRGNSGTRYQMWFADSTSQGLRGSITTNGSSTSYNTTSDYRLKENVVADWDATTRLKQLNPVRFNFISNADTTVDGFLAHEVADIVPEAISGTKDAMRDEEYEVTPAVLDEDGNEVTPAVMGTRSVPDYQGIDQSKLVPLLVKTIQELEARIAALEAN